MPVKQLTGDAPVSVDGITIDAPGLTGNVVVETGAGATRRDVGNQVPDQIRLAIRRHGGRARRTIRIEAPSDAEAGVRGATRGPEETPVGARRGRPSAMRVAVPRPRPGRAQVLLSRDEHGIVTWHLQQAPSGRDILPEDVQVFEVDRAPSGPATRTFGLPKILQVISFPLVKAGGKLIEFKVREWDRDKHPIACPPTAPTGRSRRSMTRRGLACRRDAASCSSTAPSTRSLAALPACRTRRSRSSTIGTAVG